MQSWYQYYNTFYFFVPILGSFLPILVYIYLLRKYVGLSASSLFKFNNTDYMEYVHKLFTITRSDYKEGQHHPSVKDISRPWSKFAISHFHTNIRNILSQHFEYVQSCKPPSIEQVFSWVSGAHFVDFSNLSWA